MITALVRFRLLKKIEIRTANGQIRCIGYQAQPPVLWQKPLSKTQPDENPSPRKPSPEHKDPFLRTS